MSGKEQTDPLQNPYLESPKAFHFEMPLYHLFHLPNPILEERIYKLILNQSAIDAYCIWCKKDGVFRTEERFENLDTREPFDYWLRSVISNTQESAKDIRLVYKCTRDQSHAHLVYYIKIGNIFTKAGQLPSVSDFQIPQTEKYRKVLGEKQYQDLTRGIGLAAHGADIGSFVYLRRVFENLIDETHKKVINENLENSLMMYTQKQR